MKAHYLGHVVFYVKDLERSLKFYRDLLGFQEVGRTFGGAAAALTSGRTHHELLLIEVGDAPSTPRARHLGARGVGVHLELASQPVAGGRVALAEDSGGGTVADVVVHPDGNEVELYVDADPSVWKNDPAAVLSPTRPLSL